MTVLRAGPDDDMSGNYCAGRWRGELVLGDTTGLYRVVPADPTTATGAHIEQFPQIKNTSISVCTAENGLLMLSRGKITLLDAEARLFPVAEEITEARDVIASRVRPGRVYVIDESGGISSLRLDGETHLWIFDRLVAMFGAAGDEYGLAESARGDLWVATKEHGLYRVEIVPGSPAAVTSYLGQPGPLRDDPIVLLSDGDGPLRFLSARVCAAGWISQAKDPASHGVRTPIPGRFALRLLRLEQRHADPMVQRRE